MVADSQENLPPRSAHACIKPGVERTEPRHPPCEDECELYGVACAAVTARCTACNSFNTVRSF